MLLTLDMASANIWRQVVRVDGASSVLGLATTIGLFRVSEFLWPCGCLSSRKPVWESLDHLFWCNWQLWTGDVSGCFWCDVKELVAEATDIFGCKVWFEAESIDIHFDDQAGICHGSSIFEGEFVLQQSKVTIWIACVSFHCHG